MIDLAIVIPVYKGKFLQKTLQALTNQSNKNFCVYIGNDASPDDIESIISPFDKDLRLSYKRFSQNIGRKSLVAHWHRCIDLINDEKWIWLLPDDDVPDESCVGLFYKLKEQNSEFPLFRFSTIHIDEDDSAIRINNVPPRVESGVDFIINKLKYIRNSSVAEYIFKRKRFEQIGGFPEIPLAWGSDNLAWLKISGHEGIFTINEAKVSLRQSDNNISNDSKLSKKKFFLHFDYLSMLKHEVSIIEYTKGETNRRTFNELLIFYVFNELYSIKNSLSYVDYFKIAYLNSRLWGRGYFRNLYWLFNNLLIKN